MPGYIGFRPQFNPISLQEYLTVPTMVLGEYTKAEDAYNETATKAEALKALLGERNTDNEAGWKIVDNYEKQLGDLADNISKGIQGPEAYRQARGAQRYYRENMLPLESGIPAYQKELERYNSDPSMIGARPVLEDYIKNPLYKGYMLSGDKIYADMVNQGKMAAADRSASEIKAAGAAGYLNHVQSIGYSPEEQQEYLGLVQAALNGDTAAAQQLQNSDKYSQLYQGLNAYIKDHAFDQLDNNGKLNALDRAISGQLYGMTGTSKDNLIVDQAWKEARADARARETARAQRDAITAQFGRRQMSNHVIQPKARIASFGRDGEFKENIGNAFTYDSDGNLTVRTGNKLANAMGLRNTNSLGSIDNIAEFEDILFTKDGRLKTPEELKERANELTARKNGIKNPTKVVIPEHYEKFYKQLIDFGYDPNTKFNTTKDVITQRGWGSNATQSIDTQYIGSRASQLIKQIQNLANNHNTNNPSNVGFMDIAIPTTNESLQNAIKSASDDFTVFGGLTRENGRLTYSSKGKKKVKKSDIIDAVEKHGGTLEYSPAAEGYIVTIQNEDKDLYFIDESNWDETIHNYVNIDWEGHSQTIAKLEQQLDYAEELLRQNPNSDIAYQRYLYALQQYNNAVGEYDKEWSELEQGIGASEAFAGMTNWNPNTAKFHNAE